MNSDVYLYGMILATNSFLLAGEYPKADTYGEIKQKFRLPGGETGSCATVLNSLGASVTMDGNHIGTNVKPVIEKFYQDKKVDLSPLTFDEAYEGLEDYVIIDQNTRTPFGSFNGYYSDSIKRWNTPKEEHICQAKVAGIDPFFGEQTILAAELCKKNGIPYVTIDSPYDSYLHRNAAINVVSNELIRSTYPDCERNELLEQFMEQSEGLTIITNGSKEFIYGRKSTGLKKFKPYSIQVVSTLGAGDTFKAGCVYALLHGMSDDETVQFASACSAVACTRFPLPLNPPTLEEVQKMIQSRP
ncbi:MAG: carbohydrate kinase family protein [Clostridiales bacterium]|nr:carbohydrate kinase family protein [Clostridiales bacterium]